MSYTYVCVYMRINTYLCIYISDITYVRVCVCVYLCVCVYVCACVSIHERTIALDVLLSARLLTPPVYARVCVRERDRERKWEYMYTNISK